MGTGDTAAVEDVRSRILDAAVGLAGNGEYRRSSAAAIAQAAGVSEAVFRAHFSDAEMCFLVAFDESIELAERRIAAKVGGERSWVERVFAAVEAWLDAIVAEPARARLCLVESQQMGGAAFTRYRSVRERACDWLKQGRSLSPRGLEPPDNFELFVVSGIAWVIQQRLAENQLNGLFEDVEAALQSFFASYLDPEAADVGAAGSLARAAS